MTKALQDIRDQLEDEGYELDSPEFNRQFLLRRARRCQELHKTNQCCDCKAFDFCELSKEYLRSLRFPRGG